MKKKKHTHMKDLLLKRRDTRTLTSRDQFYHKHSAKTNLVQSFLRSDHKFLPLNETAALMTSKCNLAFPDVANTMQKTLGIFSLPRLHFPRPSAPPFSTQTRLSLFLLHPLVFILISHCLPSRPVEAAYKRMQ